MKALIGIPAYNEEVTVGEVIARTRAALPDTDIIVVDDGSADRTPEIVRQSAARLVSLPCNLGYIAAIETILRYAYENNYDAVVTIDSDGQHDPAVLPAFIKAFEAEHCDMLIGSRYITTKNYEGNPMGRRIGMVVFSQLTATLTGKRIYDTTSGMKGISRRAMSVLLGWQFVDFHSEAIIYLLWSNYGVAEYPITVKEREYGTSMYSCFSHLWYPMTVVLMILVGLIQKKLYEARKR